MLKIGIEGAIGKVNFHDLTKGMHEFSAYMQGEVDRAFAEAGRPGSALLGGTSASRGITWLPVQGRYKIRPSGSLVTPMSSLLQDTGELRRRAMTDIVKITAKEMVMGTTLQYAKYQNTLRPFAFFNERDADKMLEIMDRLISNQMKMVSNG